MSYIMFPKHIELKDNISVYIDSATMKDEESFSLLIPENKLDMIIQFLRAQRGFSNATPSFNHGEDYGISKVIKGPWELHLRIYGDSYFPGYSRIQAHIEIARRYFQHLNFNYVQPVIYEPYRFYKSIFNEFILAYKTRYMVKNINENYWLKIMNPELLIPWSPVALLKTTAGIVSDKLKEYFAKQ